MILNVFLSYNDLYYSVEIDTDKLPIIGSLDTSSKPSIFLVELIHDFIDKN